MKHKNRIQYCLCLGLNYSNIYILSGQGFLQAVFGEHLYFWLCTTSQHSPDKKSFSTFACLCMVWEFITMIYSSEV